MRCNLLTLAAVQALRDSVKKSLRSITASREASRAKGVGKMALLLLGLLWSSSAWADTFGLGTAGPGNWGVLETGTGQVIFGGGSASSPSGISVNPGASANQANLGINAGSLVSSATTVINGTYYKHTGSPSDSISGTTIVGGTVQNSTGDSKINQAVTDATSASSNLARLPSTQTPPNLNNPSSNVTINGGVGRNVINVPVISLNNGITLTLSGPASASFVVNVTGSAGMTLNSASILLSGGLTAANVIFSVTTTGANVSTSGSGVVINGIVMDLNGNENLNGATVVGEVISGGQIVLGGGGDVEVVPTVPEPSAAAYFTLGPPSLIAVLLLQNRSSRRKRISARISHVPNKG